MNKNNKQKLIDIVFEIAALSSEQWERNEFYNIYDHMRWVADQLEKCGFPTKPIGSSWGVLIQEENK